MKINKYRRPIYFILPILIVALISILSACSKGTTTVSSTSSTTGTSSTISTSKTTTTLVPQYGGALKLITTQPDPGNWGWPPTVGPAYNPFLPRPLIDQLISYDEKGHVSPGLCTSWEFSDDGKTLTLHLMKGVKFHDGTDFNAKTVAFGLTAFLKAGPQDIEGLTSASQIEVVDDYTVRLHLDHYSNITINDLAHKGSDAAVSPMQAFLDKGADYMLTHPVNTGPFMWSSYTRSADVKFVKNPNYWQQGKPYLDSIEEIFMADATTAKASFLGGEAQIILNLSPANANELQKTGKYNMFKAPTWMIAIAGSSANATSPFSKLQVRQAVSYALDTKSMDDALGYGLWPYSNQLVPQGNDMYNPNIVGYPYDQQKAKDLLAQAGYPNGFDTTLYYQTGDFDAWMPAIQDALAKVGIRVTLQPEDASRYFTDIWTNGWNGLAIWENYVTVGFPPAKSLNIFMSQKGFWFPSITHPDDMQTLLDSSRTTSDENVANSDLQELNKLAIDKYCLVTPLFLQMGLAAKDPSVHGDRLYDPWYELWDPADAWLSK